MNILLMMLHAVRPSRTVDMPAVAKPFWIRKGYDALTFFGTIITHSAQEAEAFDKRFDSLKNHEMIHLYQARATHDSWVCFYLYYGWYWLQATLCSRTENAGYRLNPFELEAYRHMDELDYLDGLDETTEWRRYARMPLREREKISKF
ncbi:MAG: hypothetical protein ILA25_04055 [Prevotella sp.]|nr:hypothetical protein [Prevotella sp.]